MLLRKILIFLVFVSHYFAVSQSIKDTLNFTLERFESERYSMVQENPKIAYSYFVNAAEYFLNKRDTVNYLNCIAHLSDIDHRKGKFNDAFDLLWDAMPIATNISNKMPLLEIHQMLGILYEVYGKDSLALNHTKEGLKIAKEYSKKDSKYQNRLTSCYLDVAVQLVAMDDYPTAKKYLDSCYFSDNSGDRLYFADVVYGQIYLKTKDFEKAAYYLNGTLPYLEKKGNGFQSDVAYYLGELKSSLKEKDSAVYYYAKSIRSIDSLETRLKLKPIVLEKLAQLYALDNDHKKAFKFLHRSKSLSDSLFTIQSDNNKTLFEIKNHYKENLEKKNAQFQIQQETLELSNKAQIRLKLLIAILIFLLGIGLITVRLHSKMKQLAIKNKMNEEKTEAILEVKNKELTANALQLIEKDQAINGLLETVRTKSPESFKVMNYKYKQSNKKIWEDFQLRFTETNDKFYERLLVLHPDLTQSDLKNCALLKLNFNSKEMSHLLGISVNSVHMARSRIRKKMNLERNEDLSRYLNNI